MFRLPTITIVREQQYSNTYTALVPTPGAALSKAWVCGRPFAGIAGSTSAGSIDVLSVVSVVCCQVQVSATGRSLVQRRQPSVPYSVPVESGLSTGILYGCLQRVRIPEAVIIQFVLLKMSKVLLETC